MMQNETSTKSEYGSIEANEEFPSPEAANKQVKIPVGKLICQCSIAVAIAVVIVIIAGGTFALSMLVNGAFPNVRNCGNRAQSVGCYNMSSFWSIDVDGNDGLSVVKIDTINATSPEKCLEAVLEHINQVDGTGRKFGIGKDGACYVIEDDLEMDEKYLSEAKDVDLGIGCVNECADDPSQECGGVKWELFSIYSMEYGCYGNFDKV